MFVSPLTIWGSSVYCRVVCVGSHRAGSFPAEQVQPQRQGDRERPGYATDQGGDPYVPRIAGAHREQGVSVEGNDVAQTRAAR